MVPTVSPSSVSSSIIHSSRPLIRTLLFGLTDKEIFLIICIIGATIQIAYILERFFSYEFITRSYVGVPDSTVLPDLSVCFPIIDVINYTKLALTYPSLFNELGYRPITRDMSVANALRTKYSEDFLLAFFMSRLKINQLWDQMLPFSTIFSKVISFRITNDSFVEQPCVQNNFFSEQAFCYSFTCSTDVDSSEPMVSRTVDMYKKLTKQEVISASIYQSFFSSINNYWITLMPRGLLPRGESVKWESQVAYNVTLKHTFFFYSITSTLLRSPYATDCTDYSEKGYKSKAEMEDKCQIELGIERLGSPLTSNTLDGPIDALFGLFNYERNQNNVTYLSIVSEIVDYCYAITNQPDCKSQTYEPSSRTPLPIPGNFTEITVEQISDPIYIIEVVAKMTPLDVIIAIGSVLGTWLGFSIAYSIPQVAGIVGYKFLKLQTRKKIPDHRISFQYEPKAFSSCNFNYNHIYGINIGLHRRNDWSRRPLNNRFPPLYIYYNQQTWPLAYDAKARPWWFK